MTEPETPPPKIIEKSITLMRIKYIITGLGDLFDGGSASGETPGPVGLQDTYVSSSKPGILGMNDSAEPGYAEKQEIAELSEKYERIMRTGRALGADKAADMLEHWLYGDGSDKKLDCNWLRSHDSVMDAEDTNKKRFEEETIPKVISKTKDGQVLEEQGYWDRKLKATMWKELYYTSGTSTITSRGLFKFHRKNDWVTISGTVEHHWWDPYDWHPGLAAYIPGFRFVADADAKKLEDAGYAEPFGMYGMWHQGFSGKYGIDKGVAFFDDSKYIWGKVECGRAPQGTTGKWPAKHDAMMDKNNIPLPGLSEKANRSHSIKKLGIPVPRRNRRRRERNGWR